MDSLNENSGALNVLFAGVVALATVVYARLTHHLVAETRRMREAQEAQAQPRVLVQVEPSEVWINVITLLVRNTGGGPAYDVKLTCEPDFEWSSGKFVSSWGLFKHGLPHLAPGQTHRQFLTNILERPSELDKPDSIYRFSIGASYRNSSGRTFSEAFLIDFLQFVGMISVGTPPIKQMSESLKKLEADVNALVRGVGRIRTDIYTEDDRHAETQAALSRRAASEARMQPPRSEDGAPGIG